MPTSKHALQTLLIALSLLSACGSRASAELQPSEIAIITARGNRESEDLARYYSRVRKVPVENICLVDVPAGEVCTPEQWKTSIRPEVRKWLTEHDPQQKIRCLVTLWGIPLKISATPPDATAQRYAQFLAAERASRIKLLATVIDRFNAIAPDESTSKEQPGAEKLAAATPKPDQPTIEVAGLQLELEAALQAAQTRLGKLNHEVERNEANTQLQQLATATGGLNVLLPALNQRATSGDPSAANAKAEFDSIRGRLIGYTESRSLFEQSPPGIERDAVVLALVERTGGILAAIQWLDSQLDVVKKNETGAALDSELMLVMCPDDYPLLRWQPNYLRANYSNSQIPKFFRTLMVSRIDAPTLRLAKGLVDTAIEVENKGLRGKIYVDARGLAKPDEQNKANPQVGSYADYDRGLLALAKGVNDQTNMEVVLENTPQLFQPGQCKDAALYCGWYSLGKYVDAFDWTPGAVAYHLASSEASTLRDPGSQVWCKKMLEDGVCATMGPVYEPYLVAFPRPEEFFSLLLRGELTLVECYSLTTPFDSWMMTLIGDPLYRPFKYRASAPATAKPPADAPAPKTAPVAPTASPAKR